MFFCVFFFFFFFFFCTFAKDFSICAFRSIFAFYKHNGFSVYREYRGLIGLRGCAHYNRTQLTCLLPVDLLITFSLLGENSDAIFLIFFYFSQKIGFDILH